MKKILFFSVFVFTLFSCSKNQTVYRPISGGITDEDFQKSHMRAKNLNSVERKQIEDWIKSRDEKYYSMGLNYWVNIESLNSRIKKQDGAEVSYQYDIYDFDEVKLYDTPIKNEKVLLGRFEELEAVDDVLRYLNKGEEVTLLVPSILAYGTYGDNKKISHDMPLIIKLKAL